MLLFLALSLFTFSYICTGLLRRYALKKSIIDIPNERSSHSVPTPRGGGAAIVIVFLAALGLAMPYIASWAALGLLFSGLVIAMVGFLDDQGHIAARWRLLAHFCCALWILAWMPSLPVFYLFGADYDLGWLGYPLAALYLVWMLNLYNFMDGIDGIAGVQAITTCLIGAWLMVQSGQGDIAWLAWFLAAAVAGFLCWNFPPAKIFMGDAGSGFLGLMIAALGLYAALGEPPFLWAWMILMGVFVVDATFTLFRRLLRREAIYEAHRSHAYQYASRRFGAHRPVTLSVLLVNALWLGPWAWAALKSGIDPAICLMVAYLPLLVLAWWFKAGQLELAAANGRK